MPGRGVEACTLLVMHQRGALPADPEEWGPILFTVVRNVARNRRRRHFNLRPHQPLEAGEGVAAEGLGTDELLARAEAHVRLRSCVAELCEVQQAVVTLRMLEEQSGEDTAEALGISPNHVAVLLYRAKRSLRACMRVCAD